MFQLHQTLPFKTYSTRAKWVVIALSLIFIMQGAQLNAGEPDIQSLVSKVRERLLIHPEFTEDEMRHAIEISQRMLLVDSHVDAPMKQYYQERDLTTVRTDTEFDIPRALAGGLNAVFMSIYTSASAAEEGTSKEIAEFQIEFVERLASKIPNYVGVATCSADVIALQSQNKLALPLGLENASPLNGKVDELGYWYSKGIRYITLAHSRSNKFSDSSYDENEPWAGLSPAGSDLVQAMNKVGVMIDMSHLSDKAAWQVLRESNAPVVATHSSLRHFIPGFHRNMSDEMLIAMAEKGGLIMINFGSSFISAEARTWSNALSDAIAIANEKKELTREDRAMFVEKYRLINPFPYATIGTVVNHIERVVELAGIDHVGLGSDYEGVGDTLPPHLKNISHIPYLIAELIRRGFSEEELRKVLGGNMMRVWQAVENYAKKHGNPPQCAL